MLAWERRPLDVTIQIEDVGAAGDVIESVARDLRRGPVPHDGKHGLRDIAGGSRVDVGNEEAFDPFPEAIQRGVRLPLSRRPGTGNHDRTRPKPRARQSTVPAVRRASDRRSACSRPSPAARSSHWRQARPGVRAAMSTPDMRSCRRFRRRGRSFCGMGRPGSRGRRRSATSRGRPWDSRGSRGSPYQSGSRGTGSGYRVTTTGRSAHRTYSHQTSMLGRGLATAMSIRSPSGEGVSGLWTRWRTP